MNIHEEVFMALDEALASYRPTREEADWVFARVEYMSYKRQMAAHRSSVPMLACNYPEMSQLIKKNLEKLKEWEATNVT